MAVALLLEAHGLPGDLIFVSLGPAVRPRHEFHAVRPKHVELPHPPLDRDRLEIGVSGHHQMAVPGLEEIVARIASRSGGRAA